MPAILAQIPALPLQQSGTRLQTSAVNPSLPITALLLQQAVLPLQPSSICTYPTQLYVLIQGQGGPPTTPSAVHTHAPLLLDYPPQLFETPLQPSDVNTPPLPHILAFTLQRYVTALQPLYACAPTPPLSVFLKWRGEPPLIPSTMRTYITLLSALLLWKSVPLHQISDKPDPSPHHSSLNLQRGVPRLQPLSVHAPPPPPPTPPLYVLLQGISVPPLLPSDMRTYAPLLR